jgi:hypothetical protein
MNRITGMALVAVALVGLGRAASAESNCREPKGNLVEIFPGGNTATGSLTHGGWLDGTTSAVFPASDSFPTPIPTQVTFSSMFVLTTRHGELRGTRSYLYDFAALKAATMIIIDPVASTGIFAGATGVLYVNVLKISPGPPTTTFQEDVGGQICFAQGSEPPDR